jgi:mono/diheme cytochrome c family protein
MMQRTFGLALFLVSTLALAETPQQILDSLVRAAQVEQPGFAASASRGEQFYRAKQSAGKEAESCVSCHTPDAKARGQHVKTHKTIEPLAPVANRERFTDPAKVEKWFKRNCKEVLNRVCTPQEKADFAACVIAIK